MKNEVYGLNRQFPYEMDGLSPYSEDYMNVQLAIYKKLTGDSYRVSSELRRFLA